MLDVTDAEVDSLARGDWKAASELFRQSQAEFHAKSNLAKNSSLYVDCVEGAFVAPSERITSDMMAETRELNAIFLGYAFNNLKALRRLVEAPDTMKRPMKELLDQIETLRHKAPADMLDQVDALLSRFMEQGMAAALAASSKG